MNKPALTFADLSKQRENKKRFPNFSNNNFANYSVVFFLLVMSTFLLQQIVFRINANAQTADQTLDANGTLVINASGTVIINGGTVVQAPTPTKIPVITAAPVVPTMAPTIAPTATPSSSGGKNYYISPSGSDSNTGISVDKPFKTIQKAVGIAAAGDQINLASGTYLQDVISKKNGTSSLPIVITGPKEAVVKGGGNGRVFEINHDHITLTGFTIDGLHGSSTSSSGYRDKLIYVQGKETRSGVAGLKILNMTIKNAGGECIRLRYFAQNNEIASNTIVNCGVHDFKFNGGGKNGEAIYIGTAPEQLADGKNPTTDPDNSNNNRIHHNLIDTQGNECVDIKEASSGNIVENNKCTGQKDTNSAGLDSRGNGNTFRSNEIYGNKGAGVRLGGDSSTDGINNNIYDNIIKDNQAGGIKFMRTPQAKICGNIMTNNTGGNSVGTYESRFSPTQTCTN